MNGLASLFAKVAEGLTPGQDGEASGFPVSGTAEPGREPFANKSISGISGISGTVKAATEFPADEASQARARARASGRARGHRVEAPEMPETPEKPAGSKASLSGSLSLNPENRKREGGKSAPAGEGLSSSLAFDERAAFLEYECGLSRGEAESQAFNEFQPGAPGSASPKSRLPERDGLALWRAGLAQVSPEEAPCPGYRGEEWPQVYARALAFLDTFGAQAEALGWTAPRLFGVHPEAGIVRVDCCGGLVLPIGGAVRAITATEISFGHLTHRTKPGQPEGVPIWEFGR